MKVSRNTSSDGVSERQRLVSKQDHRLPIQYAGFLEFVFSSWLTSMIWKIYKHCDKPLTKNDLWDCSEAECLDINTERMLPIWDNELRTKGPENASFVCVWLRFYWRSLFILFVGGCVNAVSLFISTAYVTELIVSYLESQETSYTYATLLVVILAVGQVVRATSFAFLINYGVLAGARCRTAVMGLVFRKLLKLKHVNGEMLAKIVTAIGADGFRVQFVCLTIVFFISLPVYLAIGIIYVVYLIGKWCLVAVGVFFFCYCCQIRKMTEIISSIKFIKMYVWESAFRQKLKETRNMELKYLLYLAVLNSITTALVPMTPTVASIVTITTYRLAGNDISATVAFTVVTSFTYLSFIIGLLPFSGRHIADVIASFHRIQSILIQDEYTPPKSACFKSTSSIEVVDAVFKWESFTNKEQPMPDSGSIRGYTVMESPLQLEIKNLYINQGSLIGVCGPVGSGKSTFIHALLGRMINVSGHLAVSGSVAYVAQQAWIINGTVRDNILLGKPFDNKWYDKVIHACALKRDLSILPKGDQTEIGDRGINISGGQKQRLSLARAVYSKSDIYLLDDPLSAVDVHVGKHLFDQCILGVLKSKTVILVTHQLQNLQHCDETLVMQNGQIVERGHHSTLMSLNGHYSSLINTFCPKSTDQGIITEDQVSIGDENKVDSSTEKHEFETGLTTEEESEVGSISMVTYKSYISAAGGVPVLVSVLLCYSVAAGAITFSNWWLGVLVHSMNNNLERGNSSALVPRTYGCTDRSSCFGNMTNTTEFNAREGVVFDVYLTVYLASLGAIIVFSLVKGIVGSFAMVTAAKRLHQRTFKAILRAPMYFFDSNPTGRILNRFSRDMDEVDATLPMFTDLLLQNMNVVILAFVVVALTIPWVWFALLPVVGLFCFLKILASSSVRAFKRFDNTSRSPLLNHVTTVGVGLPTLVSYSLQAEFTRRFSDFANDNTVASILYENCMEWISLRLDLLTTVVTISTSVAMVFMREHLSPALAGTALNLCMSTVLVLQITVRMVNDIEGRYTSVERIVQYEKDVESECGRHSVTPSECWPQEGRIFFSDVYLRYRSSSKPILQSLKFHVSPGEKIGIVGRTGAGKSSLAAALFRLEELSGGHIYIDGTDISLIPLSVLRSKISIIPQDPVLFAGTLRYNLDPFSRNTDLEIWNALEQSYMADKIQTLDGNLEHFVEENGENFSVGEKQLLCLARAILRQNKILILDEATASIDTATDDMIQQTIQESFAGCTVLTIAHRLNTVMHCDRVFVMDAGQILETGKPHDLSVDPNSFFNATMSSKVKLNSNKNSS